MGWREQYNRKLMTADEAVRHIKSGNRVAAGHACGSPELLLKAMVANREAYKGVEIVHMVSMGEASYCQAECAMNFTHNSFFAGAASRAAIREGRAVFTPSHFSQIPRLIKDGVLPIDVTLCMLSPPDENGYCSFGISVDYTKVAAEHSSTVIAEVTPHMPRTMGDTFIHIFELDCIVECDSKPIELKPPEISKTDEKIGGYCAELIGDGSCLQLGIGAMPDAVLRFLKHKKDLGIHTEMFSDGAVDLVEAGVITCARKNCHPNVIVATFLMGSEKLYRFVHDNPMVQMFPVDYTNNPVIIAGNDKVVSLNSALQIDLTGQACSESIGYQQYSGTGGQADFIRGAAWSKCGCSILAFQSTASGGTRSRIVSHLDEGAIVTTTRTDIHYVVTEYGVADLRGKSVPARAEALIAIAHPDFRSDLRKEYSLISIR